MMTTIQVLRKRKRIQLTPHRFSHTLHMLPLEPNKDINFSQRDAYKVYPISNLNMPFREMFERKLPPHGQYISYK